MELRRAAGWIVLSAGILRAVWVLGLISTELARMRALGFVLGALYAVVLGALPLALIVVGWRLARSPAITTPTTPQPVAPRARPTPVPIVDVAELEGVPVPFEACMRCGFLGVRMATVSDGLWPGGGETGARMVCPRCDWQGLPAAFEEREDYVAFLRGLAENSRA